jgi:hypothetical protein
MLTRIGSKTVEFSPNFDSEKRSGEAEGDGVMAEWMP